MANNLANYAENALIDWLMGGVSPTRPSARWIALHTADPGETGASGELSGNGYSRVASAFGAAVSGGASNTGLVAFNASGGDFGVITHCSIWDASTGGNCLWQGPCTNKTIADGDSYQFPIGALTVSLD